MARGEGQRTVSRRHHLICRPDAPHHACAGVRRMSSEGRGARLIRHHAAPFPPRVSLDDVTCWPFCVNEGQGSQGGQGTEETAPNVVL